MQPVRLQAEPAHESEAAKRDNNCENAQHADPFAEQWPGEQGRHQRRQRHQEEDLSRAPGLDGSDEANLAGHHGTHRDPGKAAQASNLREGACMVAVRLHQCES
jgi:hypothetical protein